MWWVSCHLHCKWCFCFFILFLATPNLRPYSWLMLSYVCHFSMNRLTLLSKQHLGLNRKFCSWSEFSQQNFVEQWSIFFVKCLRQHSIVKKIYKTLWRRRFIHKKSSFDVFCELLHRSANSLIQSAKYKLHNSLDL